MHINKSLAFIIEDDEDLSIIFSGALSSAGYRTETLRNGRKALTLLATTVPDLVILDLHLPGVSGTEILSYIRAEKRLELTTVVVTTADAIQAEQVRESADLVLIKPITFSQLRDLTARLNPLTPEE